MRAKVSRWGNSLAIRLPQAAVKSLDVQESEQIELVINGDRVELRERSAALSPGRPDRQITPDNQPEPIDLPPVGKELL